MNEKLQADILKHLDEAADFRTKIDPDMRQSERLIIEGAKLLGRLSVEVGAASVRLAALEAWRDELEGPAAREADE